MKKRETSLESKPSAATPEGDARKTFRDAIETARQHVKPLVKKSLQAEDVPHDLLSFRMK